MICSIAFGAAAFYIEGTAAGRTGIISSFFW
jgi:hypothetical protein